MHGEYVENAWWTKQPTARVKPEFRQGALEGVGRVARLKKAAAEVRHYLQCFVAVAFMSLFPVPGLLFPNFALVPFCLRMWLICSLFCENDNSATGHADLAPA